MTAQLDVDDQKAATDALAACYSYLYQLARKAEKEAATEGADPEGDVTPSAAYASTQLDDTQKGEHNDMR